MAATAGRWWEGELAGRTFADARLDQCLHMLVEQLGGVIGASLLMAWHDWKNTKAAYRFFSNERISEGDILAGHFCSTRDHVAATKGPILVLQDMTNFTYQRERPEMVGITYSVNSSKDKAGRLRIHTVCGFHTHASLAVTTDGLPLGLSAIKF